MKRILAGALALLVLTQVQAGGAELNRLLVGFPAGQATDLVARLLAERLGPALNETFIVENRPGQGGSLALASLKTSPADGRTIVLAPLASLVVNPHLYRTVGYDSLKDFAPVALVADLPMLLVVNPNLPVKSTTELIAYAKANPDKLTNPSSGNGTLSHLGMEDFKRRAGVNILHVPYRGSAPAMTDMITGVVNVAIDTVTVTEPFVRSGQLRLIASGYGLRVPAFPDTPTLAEQGFPGFSLSAWLGVMVPASTPKQRVDQLAEAITRILGSTELADKLANLGVVPRPAGPAEFASFLQAEHARWGDVVRTSGVKID